MLRAAGAEAHVLRDRPGGEAPRRRHSPSTSPSCTDAQKRGADIDIRMGDARLKLKEDEDRKYALLLVDAFSSDAIPVHLLDPRGGRTVPEPHDRRRHPGAAHLEQVREPGTGRRKDRERTPQPSRVCAPDAPDCGAITQRAGGPARPRRAGLCWRRTTRPWHFGFAIAAAIRRVPNEVCSTRPAQGHGNLDRRLLGRDARDDASRGPEDPSILRPADSKRRRRQLTDGSTRSCHQPSESLARRPAPRFTRSPARDTPRGPSTSSPTAT